MLILLVCLLPIHCEECKCVSRQYFCPATSTQENSECLDYSTEDSLTHLPKCGYVWQYKKEVAHYGVTLDSCFRTKSCQNVNETMVCICKDSIDTDNSVTPRALTTCHFYHRDLPYEFLDCICNAFHLEKKEADSNIENTQKIIMIVLILMFISMMSLACIITCYVMSTRPPPRWSFEDDD